MLDDIIQRRVCDLDELQNKYAAHQSVESDLLAPVAKDIKTKIAFTQKEIEFWRSAKIQAVRRFELVTKRNSDELALLDALPTDAKRAQ